MYKQKKIAIVVPAYKEEELIKETLSLIPEYVDKIYAVDDGSPDKTFQIIQEFAEKDSRVVPIKHEKNGGVGAAIVSGYKKSLEDGMDIAVVMAGDNQMDPDYLPDLLNPIIEGRADYAKGNRLLHKEYRKGMSKWRVFGNIMLTFLTKIASGYWQLVDPQNGYTAISRSALEMIDLDSIYKLYGFANDMLIKLNVYGFRIINISHPARYGNEKSKIKYGRFIIKASWLLLRGFFWRLKMKYVILSFHPLVLFYLFGIILTSIGSIIGLHSLYLKFLIDKPLFVRGVLSTIIFIIGLQFLSFAMIFDMQMDNDSRMNKFDT